VGSMTLEGRSTGTFDGGASGQLADSAMLQVSKDPGGKDTPALPLLPGAESWRLQGSSTCP
jgi:hypothetical protein